MAATSSRTAAKYRASGQRDGDGDPGMECKRCCLLVDAIIKKNSTAGTNVKNGIVQRIERLTKITNADNVSVIIMKV
jgi:hypothetical protein